MNERILKRDVLINKDGQKVRVFATGQKVVVKQITEETCSVEHDGSTIVLETSMFFSDKDFTDRVRELSERAKTDPVELVENTLTALPSHFTNNFKMMRVEVGSEIGDLLK